MVKSEDGSVYEANYVIVSASIGVLQSNLLSFQPPLPVSVFTLSSSLITYSLVLSFAYLNFKKMQG